MAIICQGTPKIDSTDFSAQIMEVRFSGTRAQIPIPETFGTAPSVAGGGVTGEVEIRLLQGVEATDLSEVLRTAMNDATGTIEVASTLLPGAMGPTNPEYFGTALVTDWDIGGEVNSVGTTSIRLPLTAPVDRRTS